MKENDILRSISHWLYVSLRISTHKLEIELGRYQKPYTCTSKGADDVTQDGLRINIILCSNVKT